MLFVARAADVHEQRRPWVPLMLEPSYRPNGWLGIMLGSRLYYEFTEAVLSNGEDWERVADSVAQEVRRHGAPPSAGPTAQAVVGSKPQEAADVAAAAVAAPAVPRGSAGVGPHLLCEAAGGVTVSSFTTNTNIHNNNSSTIHNNNNTSIILL